MSILEEKNREVQESVAEELKKGIFTKKPFFKKKEKSLGEALLSAKLQDDKKGVSSGSSLEGILHSMNCEFMEHVEETKLKTQPQEEANSISYYEDAFKNRRDISVTFSTYDKDGNYRTMCGDVVLILKAEEMEAFGQENSYNQKSILLGKSMTLRVVSIDGKNVYLTPSGYTKYSLKQSTKDQVSEEIARSLAKGKRPVVCGRVIKVYPYRLVVNILDIGILGFVKSSQWATTYTRSFESVISEGDYYQFEVVGKAPKSSSGKDSAWMLSRKNLCPNPWEHVDIESLEENSIIVVKCAEKPEEKTYWWGVTERLPGVEVMGDFTANYDARKGIFEGISYICKVCSIKENERNGGYKVKVVPIQVVDADKEKLTAMRRVLGIRMGV